MQRMECGCVEDLSAHELVRCSKAIRQRVSLPPTLQENHAHCGDERPSLIPVMYSPPDGGGKLSCGRAPILVCCLSEYHGLSQVAVKGGVPAPHFHVLFKTLSWSESAAKSLNVICLCIALPSFPGLQPRVCPSVSLWAEMSCCRLILTRCQSRSNERHVDVGLGLTLKLIFFSFFFFEREWACYN